MKQSSLEKVGYVELMSFQPGFEQGWRIDMIRCLMGASSRVGAEMDLRQRKGVERQRKIREMGAVEKTWGDVVKRGSCGNYMRRRVLDQLELVGELILN